MREIKELLQIMLDNQQHFETGLCLWAYTLNEHGLINKGEYFELSHYIRKNRPSAFSSINAFKNKNSPFYWSTKEINLRIKWLKKHIKIN